ncbi:hypothetical protein Cgig2_004686 [Carnegiea gigantea]|uniref:Uncharacterized protein n=1 Tax=Carnegiea gigantea TaxID=171969 RepID=A0A9Q1GPI4_9CARY|nr:hypothetical protein Cgig2_004686 [Carnegiea gigantea]
MKKKSIRVIENDKYEGIREVKGSECSEKGYKVVAVGTITYNGYCWSVKEPNAEVRSRKPGQRPNYDIYNQLVYPMETHDMRKVDDSIGLVVEELNEEYNRYILPPNNGRQSDRPSLKRKDSQTQGKKGYWFKEPYNMSVMFTYANSELTVTSRLYNFVVTEDGLPV